MLEVSGNIWDFHKQVHWIVITTNGSIRKDGAAVMGRGVALQAKKRFPDLAERLGNMIRKEGNIVFASKERIITFPVKHRWMEKADLGLIEESLKRLIELVQMPEWKQDITYPIYLVRPGCGNGGLMWEDVKPILEKYLDDRFVVVEKNG